MGGKSFTHYTTEPIELHFIAHNATNKDLVLMHLDIKMAEISSWIVILINIIFEVDQAKDRPRFYWKYVLPFHTSSSLSLPGNEVVNTR